MKPFIITLIGEDKPGLLASLADIVYQHNGNWLASNFALMAGRFAGFAEVHLPDDKVTAVSELFSARNDVQIIMSPGSSEHQAKTKQATFNIIGNDKPGIVSELSTALTRNGANINRFESRCESAPSAGNTLFKAQAFIEVPADFELDVLVEAVEQIANDLMIDIESEK